MTFRLFMFQLHSGSEEIAATEAGFHPAGHHLHVAQHRKVQGFPAYLVQHGGKRSAALRSRSSGPGLAYRETYGQIDSRKRRGEGAATDVAAL